MRNFLRWAAGAALAFAFATLAFAQAPCRNCNPLSKHPVDVCYIPDGHGSTIFFRDNVNVPAILQQGCEIMDWANDTPSVNYGVGKCEPRVPDPNLAGFGGVYGTYVADIFAMATRK